MEYNREKSTVGQDKNPTMGYQEQTKSVISTLEKDPVCHIQKITLCNKDTL